MSDNNPLIGIIGTAASFGLGELNHMVGVIAGCLTCTLVTLQILRFKKNNK